MLKVVHDWSIERNETHAHAKLFATRPTIDLTLTTLALEIDLSAMRTRSVHSKMFCFFSANNTKKKLTEDDINKFIKNNNEFNYLKFDTFVKNHHDKIWVVDFDKTNWLNSTCNCPVFFKKYICKHICAIAISMSLYIPPPRAKATPFKKCRKRGRPAQVSTALNY